MDNSRIDEARQVLTVDGRFHKASIYYFIASHVPVGLQIPLGKLDSCHQDSSRLTDAARKIDRVWQVTSRLVDNTV